MKINIAPIFGVKWLDIELAVKLDLACFQLMQASIFLSTVLLTISNIFELIFIQSLLYTLFSIYIKVRRPVSVFCCFDFV